MREKILIRCKEGVNPSNFLSSKVKKKKQKNITK